MSATRLGRVGSRGTMPGQVRAPKGGSTCGCGKVRPVIGTTGSKHSEESEISAFSRNGGTGRELGVRALTTPYKFHDLVRTKGATGAYAGYLKPIWQKSDV